MADFASKRVTALLALAGEGDSAARGELLEVLYAELRALAGGQMRGERADHTLQPTALVHEAWLRLVGPSDGGPDEGRGARWESRGHFLSVAAKAMRNVLVDHARRRKTEKRGGLAARSALDEVLVACEDRALDVLELDLALERLATREAELARVVELRFFGGLTLEETGRVLGLSVRQVEGAWVAARGWLRRELGKGAS